MFSKFFLSLLVLNRNFLPFLRSGLRGSYCVLFLFLILLLDYVLWRERKEIFSLILLCFSTPDFFFWDSEAWALNDHWYFPLELLDSKEILIFLRNLSLSMIGLGFSSPSSFIDWLARGLALSLSQDRVKNIVSTKFPG